MKKTTLSALTLVLALTAGSAFAADDSKMMPPKGGEHHGPMGGKMFKETDTNDDGLISKDEWQAKGGKMFGEIDANGDGKISADEMKAHHDMKRAEWEKKKAAAVDKMEDHKGPMKDKKPAEKK